MAFHETEINEYRIFLYGKQSESMDRISHILCYYTNTLVARLSFYAGDVPLNSFTRSSVIVLNYNIERLGDVIDILRHEKPLYAHYFDESRNGYLTTTKEPAGEEES